MMRLIDFIIGGVLFLALAGCGKDDGGNRKEPAMRTVIVYFGADNEFAAETYEKIDSLTAGWEDYDGNLLVYSDAKGSVPRLVEIYFENGKAKNRVVRKFDDENSADPLVLNRVVTDIVRDYPATSYGMVMLSHASGWLPKETLGSARSVIIDGRDEMEMRDFAAALPVKFDFIVFDACFMGGIEVAYEFKEKADYLVVSPAEILVRPGFDYRNMMKQLMQPQADLKALSEQLYERCDRAVGISRSLTISVVKTAELENLAALSKELLQGVNAEERISLDDIQNFGYGRNAIFFDFGDYIKALYPERYNEFMNRLNSCLVYTKATPGFYSAGGGFNMIRNYSGLTIYVPQKAYPFLNNEYQKLKWTQRIY